MATAILVAGLVLAVAIGTLLIAPVRIVLEWAHDPPMPPRLWGRARWLSLVWRFEPSRPGPTRAPPVPRPPRRRRTSPRRAARRLRAALATRGLGSRLARLIADVGLVLLPRTLDARMRIGLEDPASTGVLYGAAHAAAWLPARRGWRLEVEPAFTGPTLAGRARAEWVLRPLRVLRPLGSFLLSPPVWRAAWAALRAGAR